MKNITKRIGVLLLAVSMLLADVPNFGLSAYADDVTVSEEYLTEDVSENETVSETDDIGMDETNEADVSEEDSAPVEEELEEETEAEAQTYFAAEESFENYVSDIASLKAMRGNKAMMTELVIDNANKTISYDGKSAEIIGNDGTVDVNKLEELLGSDIPGLENKTATVDEISDALGAEMISSNGQVIISRDYQTCMVLVKSELAVKDEKALGMAGPYDGLFVYLYENEAETKAAIERFKAYDCVKYAIPNKVSKAYDTVNDGDDYEYEVQEPDRWSSEFVGFGGIADQVTKSRGSEINDVVVAVIDTGIDYGHPEFTGRLAGKGANFVGSENANGINEDASDDMSHGTCVSGVIIMNTPSYVKVLPVKAGDEQGFFEDIDIVNAIEFAILKKVDVINMSFGALYGFYPEDSIEHEALIKAKNAGIVLIAAYGNDGTKTDYSYPASFEEVVAVSAMNQFNEITSFSTYGNCVEVSAPGQLVYTAYPTYMDSGMYWVPKNYCYANGTSFSSPFTAAAAAMLIAYYPEASAEEIRQHLYENVVDLGTRGWDIEYGYGAIQYSNFLESKSYLVDGVNYETIEAALAEFGEDSTLELYKDATLSNISIKGSCTIRQNKNVTVTAKAGESMFVLEEGATLTLGYTDIESNAILTLVRPEAETVVPLIKANGAKNINLGNGLKFYDETAADEAIIECSGSVNVDYYSADFISKSGKSPFVDFNSTGSVYLNITAKYPDFKIRKGSNIIIMKPIKASKTLFGVIPAYDCEELDCVINFTDRISNVESYLALIKVEGDEFEFEIEERAFRLVRKSRQSGISIGETNYESLAAAVLAAKAGETIEISGNISSEAVEISKNLTIKATELALVTATDTENPLFTVKKGDVLLDLSSPGSKITGAGVSRNNCLIQVDKGASLRIKGGSIAGLYSQEGAPAIYNMGSLVIDGACVESNENNESGAGLINKGTVVLTNNAGFRDNSSQMGSAIYNAKNATLTIENAIMEGNTAELFGGAIFNLGNAVIKQGTFKENKTVKTAEGFYSVIDEHMLAFIGGQGGAITNLGTMTIEGGNFVENEAKAAGGAIFNGSNGEGQEGKLIIKGGIFTQNRGLDELRNNGFGGAICNSGDLEMTGGEISDNYGLVSGGVFNMGKFKMTGGEISNNNIVQEYFYVDSMYCGTEIGYWNGGTENYCKLLGGKIYSDNYDPNPEIYLEEREGDYYESFNFAIGDKLELGKKTSILNHSEYDRGYAYINVSSPLAKRDNTIRIISETLDDVSKVVKVTKNDKTSLKLFKIVAPMNWSKGVQKMDCGTVFEFEDGVLRIYPNTSTKVTSWEYYVSDEAVKELIFEEGITKVAPYLFQGMDNLEKVTFPSTLTDVTGPILCNDNGLKTVIFNCDYYSENSGNSYDNDFFYYWNGNHENPLKIVCAQEYEEKFASQLLSYGNSYYLAHYLQPVKYDGKDAYFCHICKKYFEDIDEKKALPVRYEVVYDSNLPEECDEALTGAVESQFAQAGKTYTVRANGFNLERYEFVCWSTNKDGLGKTFYPSNGSKNKFKNLTDKCETVTLYAQWKISDFSIRFDANKGNRPGRVSGKVADIKGISYSAKYSEEIMVTIPEKGYSLPGYTFMGWSYSRDDFDTEVPSGRLFASDFVDFAHQPKDIVILYALWQPNTYEVELDANVTGTDSVKETFTYNESRDYSAKFSRTGYHIASWNTKANGRGKSYPANLSKDLTTKQGDKFTLYAQWAKNKYSVSYETDGAKNSNRNPKSYTYETKELKLYNLSKTGNIFMGWTVIDEEGYEYTCKQEKGYYSLNTEGVASNLTVKANWQEIRYTIRLMSDSKTELGSYEVSYSEAIFGSQYSEIADELVNSRPSHTFKGWFTKANGKGKCYTLKEGGKSLTNKDKETVTLYLEWVKAASNTTYNVVLKTGIEGWDDITINDKPYDELISMQNDPQVFGLQMYLMTSGSTKTIKGFKSSEDRKFYSWGSLWGLTRTDKKTITLTAVWEPVITYNSIQYENCMNATNPNPSMKEYGKTLTLKAPKKEGYKFLYWYMLEDGKEKKITSLPKDFKGGTVYAKWEIYKYSITYNFNGGTYPSKTLKDTDIPYGTFYSVKNTEDQLTRKGYVLTGWNTAKNMKGQHYNLAGYNNRFTVNKNLTLYAEWKKVIAEDLSDLSVHSVFNGTTYSFSMKTDKDVEYIEYEYYTSESPVIRGEVRARTKGYYAVDGKWDDSFFMVRARGVKTDSQGNKFYGSWSDFKKAK